MPQPHKAKEVPEAAAPSNPFSVLADTDSDEEPSTKPVPPASPPLRTWNLSDQPVVGKSPFHRQRRRHGPRETDDGWVSLKTMAPPAASGEEQPSLSIQVTYEPRTPPYFEERAPARTPPGEFDDVELPPPVVLDQKFPSLLSRGSGSVIPKNNEAAPPETVSTDSVKQPQIILSETISRPQALEELSAFAWAERVKKSLERAEGHVIKVEEKEQKQLGRLSFFKNR